jgi:hypothetical protein
MPDYRAMFDRDYIGAWDLPGDVVVTISAVEAGTIKGDKGRTSRKPIIRFKGKEKALLGNKTNCKIIARLYGTDTDKWIGKDITLFPTTTEMGGETVDCIRVRPQAPARRAKGNGKAAQADLPPANSRVDANGDLYPDHTQEPPAGPGLEEHDAREPD